MNNASRLLLYEARGDGVYERFSVTTSNRFPRSTTAVGIKNMTITSAENKIIMNIETILSSCGLAGDETAGCGQSRARCKYGIVKSLKSLVCSNH